MQLLALAETIQLSEWKAHAQKAECLSLRELLQRAAVIEQLLGERTWRESLLDDTAHLSTVTSDKPSSAKDETSTLRLISDVFFAATQVLLAAVVNGAFPKGQNQSYRDRPYGNS